jgi:hypothetical protein
MNVADFNDEFEVFLSQMREIITDKGHDYAAGNDRLANFKHSIEFNISPWKGILVRLSDKFSRLTSFATQEEMKVKSESLEDTCLDIANYAFLLLCAYKEEHNVFPKEKE